MYSNYQVVDYNTRSTLGFNSASAYASSVLTDLVGLLTGTITSVSQLSSYADKSICSLQGAAGNWTVYDADAHPGFPGLGKVLRRLCVDGINYQYLFLAFKVSTMADIIGGVFGVMGGWNTATKSPTTPMYLQNNTVILAGTAVTAVNVNIGLNSGNYFGSADSFHFNTGGAQTRPSVPYKILCTGDLLAIWPDPVSSGISFPQLVLAEYNNLNPWSNSASGAAPIVYTVGNSSTAYMPVNAPLIKNSVGNLVIPDFVGLSSVAGNSSDSAAVTTGFNGPSSFIYDYARNAAGNKAIPVLPIDITLRTASGGYFCYAGRLRSLFATLPVLAVSDTFLVGTDTYVIIPTGRYHPDTALYSSSGKLCAKIQ